MKNCATVFQGSENKNCFLTADFNDDSKSELFINIDTEYLDWADYPPTYITLDKQTAIKLANKILDMFKD
ncbi:hypothetical protein RYD26_12050 [Pasteurellaceae bacterium LIM206]|nr:hypothetical protein [Pasteurellaceae bacterium LIM206]